MIVLILKNGNPIVLNDEYFMRIVYRKEAGTVTTFDTAGHWEDIKNVVQFIVNPGNMTFDAKEREAQEAWKKYRDVKLWDMNVNLKTHWTRFCNVMYASADITTVEDLMTKMTVADALKLRGLGTTCVEEVQKALWLQFNINWK
jgi:hypothetical protein